MYICNKCEFNNNGWCYALEMNGLKKMNIQKCNSYKGRVDEVTKLEMMKIPAYNKYEMVLIKINSEEVEVPLGILKDFIEDEGNIKIKLEL